MGTPRKRAILTSLKSTLEGISVADGYKTTVMTVSDTVADWETARQEGQYPYIGIRPARNTPRHEAHGNMRMSMLVQLACHVDASSDKQAYDKLEDLLDDIIAVIAVDPTRGGAAISTIYDGDDTDEGDPDKNDSRGGSGSMVVDIRITYERTTAQS